MKHSNRSTLLLALGGIQVFLFILAILSAYLSQNALWGRFAFVSIVATILFVAVKGLEIWPGWKELFVRDDAASKLVDSAMKYGVAKYFNMQDPVDQANRNKETQAAIDQAQAMWLCANSGASFLDPAVYRHWPNVESKLKEGVEFRVVLLDPLSKEKDFRNQLNVSGESADSKLNLTNLVKLAGLYPNLEIRFASFGMHATVFATGNLLFFDPYQAGLIGDRIENRSFSLLIDKVDVSTGVSLYRLFKAHFDSLWRTSVSLGDWLERRDGDSRTATAATNTPTVPAT